MKLKRGLLNISLGFFSQLIILILGFFIPKLFIDNYGSEVNGLFSTITQIFAYVALLEAGIGAATVRALYKPVSMKEYNDISGILSATRKYYNKISLYYLFCVLLLAVLYPLLVDSSISKVTIGIIVLLQGLTGVIHFYFQATLKQLIIAEGRSYVLSNIALMINICSSITKITLIYLGADIIYIQVAFFGISLLQLLLFQFYFRRKYTWVDFKVKPSFDKLAQRNAFLIHQVSSLVFSSTDMLILSIFSDFKTVSIYAIYNLVILSLNTLIKTVNESFSFVLGHTYHVDKKKYMRLHDAYHTFYITLIFSIMSVCYMLFLPFIRLYTQGADINYVDSYLPLLFCLIPILSCIRMVPNNLIIIEGHMQQTVVRTIVEASINLVVSVVLMNLIGIYGVLLGTIVALLYRSNDIILYSDMKILKRNPLKTYKPIIINSTLFVIVVLMYSKMNIIINSYFEFFQWGIIFSSITLVYFIVISVSSRREFKFVIRIIKPHAKKLFIRFLR
ncbi:lipopolysaccharide biosynthesis protein [Peribacillus butanolivorans]|uniref:lipopolysaccharide biosynthesis protein n=1 Tax=Peribacillus butanolivorans TaxID=421767 RepID=UPI0036C57391